MSRAKTKKVVIQIEDWIDKVEAWEEDILMFFNYGKDLLGFLKQQHPETVEAFMKSRKTLTGKLEKSLSYPSMLSVTDGEYFKEQLEKEKKEAEVNFLKKFTEKPNEYTEAQNG